MNEQSPPRAFLNYNDAARFCGISVMSLRRAVAAGRLRVYHPGGRRLTRFALSDLESYMRGDEWQAAEGEQGVPTALGASSKP